MSNASVADSVNGLVSDSLWQAASQSDLEKLVDLACIDLMQRKRAGQAISAVAYLNPFPMLAESKWLLDLIDADLCICIELQLPSPADFYCRQFPDLASKVRDLVRLQDPLPADVVLPSLVDSSTCDLSSGFSVDNPLASPLQSEKSSAASADLTRHQTSTNEVGLMAQPATALTSIEGSATNPMTADFRLVDTPSWFVGRQCIAAGPGHWLIRGRDEVRGVPLAMKVVRMPEGIDHTAASGLLDLCEAASKVQHPAWVTPIIATVQNQHLGIIRPWWFARGMPREMDTDDRINPLEANKLLSRLATIAFAIAAAHQAGATHGAIHPGNVLVDHDGQWKLVDAVAGRLSVSRYLTSQDVPSAGDLAGVMTFESRREIDVQDLVKMIAALLFSSQESVVEEMVLAFRGAAKHESDPAAEIGSLLMSYADGVRPNALRSSLGSSLGSSSLSVPSLSPVHQWWSRWTGRQANPKADSAARAKPDHSQENDRGER